jgi:NAD(P)-dependent dehydrogenase (short-subunit alcohol dehydrogenase family)
MKEHVANLLSLEGKVAIVTGAATGIGEGIAHVLADAGAHVVIADIDVPGAERVAAAITGDGGAATAVTVDVVDPNQVHQVFGMVERQVGPVSILVNNAGSYRAAGAILEMSTDVWRSSVAINLDSVFHCTQAVARLMLVHGGGGAVVNIASVDGILPCIGVNYDSAKAGVIQFTRSAAVDLSPHKIRVNAVAPGFINVQTLARIRRGELPPIMPTPTLASGLSGPVMSARSANIPLGRAGEPRDIGNAVLFLCSGAASYITGHTVVVDGGWLLV